MYVSPGSTNTASWGAFGDGAVIHSSGYGVTDTAGAIPANTKSPGFSDVTGGGGLFATYDASSFFGLTGDQSLTLKGAFDYSHDSIAVGSAPTLAGLIVGNSGSINGDTYTFGGAALYRFGTSYFAGEASYNFGRANETNNTTVGSGSFSDSGYRVYGTVGHVFVLSNTFRNGGSGAMLAKAAPKANSAGTIVGLDLSGHIGYFSYSSDGFAETSGFVFGSAQTSAGDGGVRARLFASTTYFDWRLVPYVSATVDQLFSLKDTETIPNQPALLTGDIVNFNVAKTFGGADLGLDVVGTAGWVIGAKGFYKSSSDTSIVGGLGYVKIPFNYQPTVAARY